MVKRLSYLFTGWMWFAITIAPVIGIIQISGYAMADHYHYIPSIGIAVMLAWGMPALIKSEEIRKKVLLPAGITFLAIMAFLSWNQCGNWKNSFILLNHALRVTKDNPMAYNLLGTALLKKGENREAIYNYSKAILIAPDYVYAYRNRGDAYANLGQYQLAIDDYNEAILLQPDFVFAYCSRGFAYFMQGKNKLGCIDAKKACKLGNCKILESAAGRGLCR
jgi:protein O-mannosyl-transferase